VEPGEDEVDALVRELLEETGLVVERSPSAAAVDAGVDLPVPRQPALDPLPRQGRARLGRQASPLALTDDEQGSILGRRWWTVRRAGGHTERFFPPRAAALVPQVLAGRRWTSRSTPGTDRRRRCPPVGSPYG
jgi:8-oxo-dGTP pyrophosphatase MutT (NUDIX family)